MLPLSVIRLTLYSALFIQTYIGKLFSSLLQLDSTAFLLSSIGVIFRQVLRIRIN